MPASLDCSGTHCGSDRAGWWLRRNEGSRPLLGQPVCVFRLALVSVPGHGCPCKLGNISSSYWEKILEKLMWVCQSSQSCFWFQG